MTDRALEADEGFGVVLSFPIDVNDRLLSTFYRFKKQEGEKIESKRFKICGDVSKDARG